MREGVAEQVRSMRDSSSGHHDHRAATRATGENPLLPRARIVSVIAGQAPLVGSRLNPVLKRGWVSPVEARVHLGIPYGDLVAEEATLLQKLSLGQKLAIVLRAFVAWIMAPRDGKAVPHRPLIVSTRVDNITINEALDEIVAPPPGDRARIIFIVHPHALNIAKFNRDYAELLQSGHLVLPDGIGIRIAASILGIQIRHNINGTDLLPLLCKAVAQANLPLVLIGGKEGIAKECAANLQRDTPGLRVALTHQGYLSHEGSEALVQRVRALQRSVVLVGMGTPIQERWVAKYFAHVPGTTVITVGGLFDFFSGRVPRAPIAWRELGLEWLWRMRTEPRRLAKRYLIGNPLFLALACAQRVKEFFRN
jgi:N-acetylglucosaminyldiphosphoundecaprenol N-acetyl-beta-D-mannosaminyltransferase